MAIDLKTLTPDTSFGAGAFLFGADSQIASSPSVYGVDDVFGYLLGLANTWTADQTITPTWNDSGTTFTALKANVTDTESAADSLLMDLQVGGSSRFSVSKAGVLSVASTGGFYIGTGSSRTDFVGGSGTFSFNINGFARWSAAPSSLFVENGYQLNISAVNFHTATGSATIGALLGADAANTLAQRNGDNAQAFNIYNTYTDGSNYERGFMKWVSNTLQIGTEAAGTGSPNRVIQIRSFAQLDFFAWGTRLVRLSSNGVNIDGGTGAGNLLWITDNTYDIGFATGSRPRNVHQAGYWQTSEMTAPAAPAANGVRIYAEDDGAGKTRLMALFASGAAQQIAIEP